MGTKDSFLVVRLRNPTPMNAFSILVLFHFPSTCVPPAPVYIRSLLFPATMLNIYVVQASILPPWQPHTLRILEMLRFANVKVYCFLIRLWGVVGIQLLDGENIFPGFDWNVCCQGNFSSQQEAFMRWRNNEARWSSENCLQFKQQTNYLDYKSASWRKTSIQKLCFNQQFFYLLLR